MNNLQEAASFLYQSDDFLVVSHVKPDGDVKKKAGIVLQQCVFLKFIKN